MKHTLSFVLVLLVPAALAAQQDTTHRAHARRSARHSHYQTSSGSVALRGEARLSSDEVRQLQGALQSDGCSPGAVDGVIGPRTRQAMACGRRKLGVSSSEPNALFQALNLNFATRSSEPSGRTPHAMGGMRDSTMMHPDTGEMSGSRMSHHMEAQPGRRKGDSTRTPRARGDSAGLPSADRPHASIPRTPRPDSTRPPR